MTTNTRGSKDHPDRWFGVELRHLAAVAAVAREGSFRGAADSLGYVQSAISQQIAQLEHLTGSRLIERKRGSQQIAVTSAGELLVQHAEGILARVQAARADLTFATEDPDRTITVGVFPSIATEVLPKVMRAVAARAPSMQVELVEAASDSDACSLVERAEVDLAFAELPLPAGPFRSRTVVRDPSVLLVAAGSELADRGGPPTLEELAEAKLITLESLRFTTALEPWFAAQGMAAKFTRSTPNEATLRAMVAAGTGVAIVPLLAVERWDPRIVAIPLDGIVPDRRIALCWHGERLYADALEQFCETACNASRQLADLAAEVNGARLEPVTLTAA